MHVLNIKYVEHYQYWVENITNTAITNIEVENYGKKLKQKITFHIKYVFES